MQHAPALGALFPFCRPLSDPTPSNTYTALDSCIVRKLDRHVYCVYCSGFTCERIPLNMFCSTCSAQVEVPDSESLFTRALSLSLLCHAELPLLCVREHC